MAKQSISKVDNEEKYLRKNAFGCLLLGSSLILSTISGDFDGPDDIKSIIFMVVIVILLLTGAFFILSAPMFGRGTKNYWMALLEDEYLNHLNMRGYKWAFTSVTLGLLPIMLLGDSYLAGIFEGMSLGSFAELIIGVAFMFYSLPIAYDFIRNR